MYRERRRRKNISINSTALPSYGGYSCVGHDFLDKFDLWQLFVEHSDL